MSYRTVAPLRRLSFVVFFALFIALLNDEDILETDIAQIISRFQTKLHLLIKDFKMLRGVREREVRANRVISKNISSNQ